MNQLAESAGGSRERPFGRFGLLGLAAFSLVAGAWAGLARLGLPIAAPHGTVLAVHGGLMVSGVLGTLIGVERAVALDQRWAFAAPLATGLGAVFAFTGIHFGVVLGAFLVGSLFFVAANVMIILRQFAAHAVIMLLGAVAWATGNLAWMLGTPVSDLVYAWMAFLVLTIVGERLELSRMRPPPVRCVRAFIGITSLLFAGALIGLFRPALAGRVVGITFVLSAGWLVRHDVARTTVRSTGLPRFAAVSVLAGYVWLAATGALLVTTAPQSAGAVYDATLHSLFLGFVFSMIFGHAPIILPAVLRVAIPYARLLYVPVVLLHASVAVRIAGDLVGAAHLRQCGGILNIVALLAFALSVAVAKRRARNGPADATRPAVKKAATECTTAP